MNDQILEIFYRRESELCKTAFFAISAAYPEADRKKSNKLEYIYAEAMRQVRYHRNFYKNIVKDSILPLAVILKKVDVFEPTSKDATDDFRKLLAGQFDMLYVRLKDYAGLLLPLDKVDSFIQTLENVYPKERLLLLGSASPEGIANYLIQPKYTKPEDFLKLV